MNSVFTRMNPVFLLAMCLVVFAASESFAKVTRPSSGRSLRYGHWLTCSGGGQEQGRMDPAFHSGSPEEEVAAYVPKFSGRYGFEVKDTWEELVTKSGSNCSRCGETCRSRGKSCDAKGNCTDLGQDCSCNFCSWQELETFYAPWSNQSVDWRAEYVQDQNYRQKRRDWIAKGKPKVSREKSDLPKLFEFDPERPLEYFLFPGEIEIISASNGTGFLSSGTVIAPRIEVERARHEYKVALKNSIGPSSFDCDDRNYSMQAQIYTGKRLVTTTPNSIQFGNKWLAAAKNPDGSASEEPGAFELTDLSARRYEGQNIFDHYKKTKVQVWLEHIDRFWWFGDTRISKKQELKDDTRRLKWDDSKAADKTPAVGIYSMYASDLLKTRYFGSDFHLASGQKYSVCTRMLQEANIYYKTTYLYFFDDWSDENCAVFTYSPPEGQDKRSGFRKTRDFLSRILGFGLF